MYNKMLKTINPMVKKDVKKDAKKELSAPPVLLGLAGMIVLGPYVFDETIGYQANILKINEYILINAPKITKGATITLGIMSAVILIDAIVYFSKNN